MLILGYKPDAFMLIKYADTVVQDMQLELVGVKIELQFEWAVCLRSLR